MSSNMETRLWTSAVFGAMLSCCVAICNVWDNVYEEPKTDGRSPSKAAPLKRATVRESSFMSFEMPLSILCNVFCSLLSFIVQNQRPIVAQMDGEVDQLPSVCCCFWIRWTFQSVVRRTMIYTCRYED